MKYYSLYQSPLGTICMKSDEEFLTNLTFTESNFSQETYAPELAIFKETTKWLDIYFSGKNPDFTPKYKIENLTPFRKQVLEILTTIPYGETMSYNDIAKIIAQNNNINKMSAQAVGGAVRRNPICIIIPCHRVIGSNKSLVGYAYGFDKKIGLLETERISYIISNKKMR